MPFYEYQGQVYEIDTKDKRAARTKIQGYLDRQQPPTIGQQIAREAAGTLDIIGELPRTAARGISYVGSRLGGSTPEQAQATAERISQQVPTIGSMTGAEYTPQYSQGSLRQLQSAIGERVAPVIESGARRMGVDPRDITYPLEATAAAPMVPSALAGAQAAARGVSAVGRGAADFAGGVVRGATRTGQDLVRLGDTYIPRSVIDDVRAGRMSFAEAQAQARPTAELGQGRLGQAAMAITGGRVPVEGRGMSAFGQRLGESTRSPASMMADIGFPLLTGVPIPPVMATRAAADLYLARQGGMLPQQTVDTIRAADLYRQAAPPVNPADIATAAAAQAQRGPLPVPESVGPAAPTAPVQAQSNPNNISILRQTYPNLPEADIRKIETERRAREIVSNSKTSQFPIPNDVAKRLAGDSVDRDMAAIRLQEMEARRVAREAELAAQPVAPAPVPVAPPAPAAPLAPVMTPEQQALIDQIRARKQQTTGTPSVLPAETPPPIASSSGSAPSTPGLDERLAALRATEDPTDPRVQLRQAEQAEAAAARPEIGSDEWRALERERATRLQEDLSRPRTALDDYNEWQRDPAGYIRRQGGPGGVSQMIVPESPGRRIFTEDQYNAPSFRDLMWTNNPDGSREISYQKDNTVITDIRQPTGMRDLTTEYPNGFVRETRNPDGSIRERIITRGDDTVIEEISYVAGNVPGQTSRQVRTEQWIDGRRSTFIDGQQIKGTAEPMVTFDDLLRQLQEGK